VTRLALRKIGIYGGTFDPVHHAHLILAREAREMLDLEKVIFVPAAVSPFKKEPLAAAEMRLAMLQAALEGERGLTVDDCELRRGAPSYTIDTVEEIQERESNAEIYYLLGEDNLPTLTNWHRFAELQNLVRFVVLDRTGANSGHSYPIVRRSLDISATEIRKRVASQQSIRYFVPPAVEEIILRANLYREKVK
jgi:nicotinate-nucleotide adenylyltransferase